MCCPMQRTSPWIDFASDSAGCPNSSAESKPSFLASSWYGPWRAAHSGFTLSVRTRLWIAFVTVVGVG
jgi:hypothetical protein